MLEILACILSYKTEDIDAKARGVGMRKKKVKPFLVLVAEAINKEVCVLTDFLKKIVGIVANIFLIGVVLIVIGVFSAIPFIIFSGIFCMLFFVFLLLIALSNKNGK